MKDPQKKHVYRWEESRGWNKNQTTLDECVKWIKKACKLYDIPVPEIRTHEGEFSWCIVETPVISMRLDGELNIPIALHETAHYIVYKLRGYRVQDHGPFFASVYLDLLERAKVPNVRESARSFGIKWKEKR